MNEDGLKPSPLLGYKLAPPAKDYYVGPIIPTQRDLALFRERLILDIVNYIAEHNILNDVFDSLVFLSSLIFEYHNDHIFMDEDTPQKDIFEITSGYGNIPLEGTVTVESSALTLPYIYTSLEDLSILNGFEYSISKPIKIDTAKIKNYPDIQSVLDRVSQTANTSNSTKVKTVLSALYILTDQVDKAIKIYKDKLNNNSMEDFDHYNLGIIHLERKNTKKAREQFEKIKELDEARYHLGMTYLYEEEWEKASGYFNEFIAECHPEYEPPMIDDVTLDRFIRQFSCNNLGICLDYCRKIGV
jgi:tetratricopeptide (TPR) repeat protein